jgi:DNA-binding MarR family transcriptional regulator
MRDEVDDLVEAWGRERGDLDLAPVEVFSRISRLARHLDLARRDAFTAHGIESWEFDVLAALRRAGAPYELSPGRLLRETLVTSGTMTNRVDRLTGRGLVERLPDPKDRRGVLVRLTVEGKAAVDGAFEASTPRRPACCPSSRTPTVRGSPACCARCSRPSADPRPARLDYSTTSEASSHSISSSSFSAASAPSCSPTRASRS